MDFYQVIIEKHADTTSGLQHWANTYTVKADGGIDGDSLRNFCYWLTLAESNIHLQHVTLSRVILRLLDYTAPNGDGFRALRPFGRDKGTRPTTGTGSPLPLEWALHVKKQMPTGRSGHMAYRGVLHSCDVTVNPYRRIALKTDSDLCGDRWGSFQAALLDLIPMLVSPGPSSDLVIEKVQKSATGLFVGGPQDSHGRKIRHQYTKSKCLAFKARVDETFRSGADALARLESPPVTITDTYNVDSIRDVWIKIMGCITGGKGVLSMIDSIMEEPNGLEEEQKCRLSDKTIKAAAMLSSLEPKLLAWTDEGAEPFKFLQAPPSYKPKADLAKVLDQARSIVTVWDLFRTKVAFDPYETFLQPKPETLLAANLARSQPFPPCDEATREYFESLMDWPSASFFKSQFKSLLMNYGRKKLAQWTQLPPMEEFDGLEEKTLAYWNGVQQQIGESLIADPVMAAAFFEEFNAFVEAEKALLP
jgi:hypothetical protein